MFKRQYRLPAQVRLPHSRIISSPYFTVKIAKNDLPYNRYGFVVGKVIDKRAVYRNTLKRRFRAYVEELHEKLEVGYDVLFLLRKSAIEKTTQELADEIDKILRQVGLLKI
jgi:ribonuclease P protein component